LQRLANISAPIADKTGETMSSSAKTAPAEKPASCLARQPILNKDEKVVGYELLFRESPDENRFNSDFESGTRSIIDTLNVMGLDVVCDGRLAFINCTQEMLLKEFLLLLPAEKNGGGNTVPMYRRPIVLSLPHATASRRSRS
jgi:hypothetical protein